MLKVLENAFAEMDAENLAKQTEWAIGRMEALNALRKDLQPQRRAMGEHAYYMRMFECAGGKGWYNVFNGSNERMVREFVIKNCKAIADKRNATIVKKLTEIGVTEIGNLEFQRNKDGFNGVFVFEGARIEIRTIIAGGYNIQCLHERTLVYANGKRA